MDEDKKVEETKKPEVESHKDKTLLESLDIFLKKSFKISLLALFLMRKWPQHQNLIYYICFIIEQFLIVAMLYYFWDYKTNFEKYMPRCEYIGMGENWTPIQGIDFVLNNLTDFNST